jgi:hypothetical protein
VVVCQRMGGHRAGEGGVPARPRYLRRHDAERAAVREQPRAEMRDA